MLSDRLMPIMGDSTWEFHLSNTVRAKSGTRGPTRRPTVASARHCAAASKPATSPKATRPKATGPKATASRAWPRPPRAMPRSPCDNQPSGSSRGEIQHPWRVLHAQGANPVPQCWRFVVAVVGDGSTTISTRISISTSTATSISSS